MSTLSAASTSPTEPIAPPTRLLCGPGPTNVDPRVIDAMTRPMVSHLDPVFHEILLEVVDLLKAVYRRQGGLTIALPATGTSGMEAGLITLLEPGDKAIVAQSGFFGARVVDFAKRARAEVIELSAPLGQHVPNDEILAALAQHPDAKLVAVVHAETSTGVRHPLAELAAAMRDSDALLYADCVTSLGGIELEPERWGVDYSYSCTQKCVGAPPGMSPVSLSNRALERIRARKLPVPFTFDFDALAAHWTGRPVVYHHTMPILHIYALHEALRLVLEEGLEERWARHADAGSYLQEQLRSRGLELLADPEHQLAQLTAVRVPEGVDGKAVQGKLLEDHGIEIGGGLGPTAPPIWRIGLMGVNATRETADRVLGALDETLA
jgi:alanine-glyoxylate transaminase/serine-glyoxylate transaminase/serine-pyruvate transaminase